MSWDNVSETMDTLQLNHHRQININLYLATNTANMVEWDENVNACSQSKYLLECFCDPHQGISQIDRVQDCNKTQTDVATFSGQSDIILSATISIGRSCLYLCSATMAFSLSMLAPVRSATWNIFFHETKVHTWQQRLLKNVKIWNFAFFNL